MLHWRHKATLGLITIVVTLLVGGTASAKGRGGPDKTQEAPIVDTSGFEGWRW